MDNRTNKIVASFAKEVWRDYNLADIYLFGSRAKGSDTATSDIDIAIVLDWAVCTNFIDTYGMLWQIASKVDRRIEPKLLINSDDNDKFTFLYEVKTTGVKIENPSTSHQYAKVK